MVLSLSRAVTAKATRAGPGGRPGPAGEGRLDIQLRTEVALLALRTVEKLSRGPEEALELAVRRTSQATIQAAVSLLPSRPPPVRLGFL